MRALVLYIRSSGVLFDCPSAQCWRRRPAAPVRRNPGSRRAGRPERDMERLHIRVRPATLLSSYHQSVTAQQAHHFALDADAIRPEDPRFVGRIGGLERN